MKNIIIYCLIAALATLASCGVKKKYAVRLNNNALVTAVDDVDRPYSAGDTVCVWAPDNHEGPWTMDNNGYMIEDNTTRIGVILSSY